MPFTLPFSPPFPWGESPFLDLPWPVLSAEVDFPLPLASALLFPEVGAFRGVTGAAVPLAFGPGAFGIVVGAAVLGGAVVVLASAAADAVAVLVGGGAVRVEPAIAVVAASALVGL